LNFNFKFNDLGISNKINKRFEKIRPALLNTIINDTDKFVPLDTSRLKQDVKSSSDFSKGIIRYNPAGNNGFHYAKKVYNLPSSRIKKVKNPTATSQWFVVSKKVNMKKWIDKAQILWKRG
jgi:hypothetical protein